MKYTIIILSLLSLSISFAQDVVGISLSNCDSKSDPYYIYRNRLISKKIENDTLSLQIGVVRNCSFEPKIALSLKGDSLIIEIENTSEIWMGCECCYEMNIKATGVKDTSFLLILKYTASDFTKDGFKEWDAYSKVISKQNKYIFPSSAEIEQLPPNNNFYQDSLKIGPWHIYDNETKKIKAKAYFFISEEGKSRTLWYARFNDKGELIEVCGNAGVDSDGNSFITCVDKEEYLKLNFNEP
jgi:hypothetical protein